MNQRKAASGGIVSLFILAMLAGITILPSAGAVAVPTFVDGVTVDGFGALTPNGRIDAIEIEMSEAIFDSSVRPGDFSVTGYTIIGFSTDVGVQAVAAAADDKYFTLLLRENDAPDTDATPATSYTKGTLQEADAAANLAATKASITLTDGALPVLIGQTLKDTVLAGGIEGYAYLTFSEPVNFLAAKYDTTGCAAGIDGTGTDIVSISPSGATKVPVLALQANPTTADAINIAAADAIANCVLLKDASTGIVTVHMDQGSDVARFLFDTPLESTTSQALVGSQVQVVSGGAVTGFTSFTHTAGSNQATAVLNAKTTAGDIAGTTFKLLQNIAQTPGSEITADATVGATADGSLPRVLSATTADVGADGTADKVVLTLNQAVKEISTGTWTFTNTPALTVSGTPGPGLATTASSFDVLFTPAAAGQSTPDLQFSQGVADTLVDSAGNKFSLKRFAVTDGVAPIVSSYSTVDANADGSVEAILITMSEPIDDTFITIGDFTVVGATVAGFNTKVPADGAAAGTDDATFLLTITTPRVGTGYDAAFTAAFTTTTLKDLAGNVAVAKTVTPILDGAAPVIISASGSVGVAELTLKFSENVDNGANAILDSGDLQWVSSNGGASGITGVAGTLPTAQWTVTANAPLVAADLSADKIHAIAASVFEVCASNCVGGATEQSAAVTQKTLSTVGATTITGIKTNDKNGDGSIDGMVVTFSGTVDDSTYAPGQWAITIGATTYTAAAGPVDSGTTADDNTFIVDFTPVIVGTSANVNVVFTAGVLDDLAGGQIASFSGISTDGAGPVLLSVASELGSTSALLTFSENVLGTGTSSAVQRLDLVYNNLNGAGTGSISGASQGTEKTKVTATLNIALASGDFSTDKMGASVAVVDAAGNVATANQVSFNDATAPTIVSIKTEEKGTPNGVIDQIRVKFSEDVLVSTATPANWAIKSGATTEAPKVGIVQGADNTEWLLEFDTAIAALALKTDATVTVDYTKGTTADAAANLLASFTGISSTDGAFPVLLTAATRDANGNGKVDGLDLTYSEPVDDSTFTVAGWGVTGYTVTNWSSGTVADDTIGTLVLQELTSADSAATPPISAGTGIKDPSANIANLGAVTAATDGAKPAIIGVISAADTNSIKVTFSEPVWAAASQVGALTTTDFQYVDVSTGGSSNFIGFNVAPVAGGTVFDLKTDTNILSADFTADKVGPFTGQVFDGADLLSVTPTIRLDGLQSDTTAPGAIGSFTATSATTAVNLAWTTPADTDLSTFEIRYSTTALTAGNFATGTLFAGPTPVSSTAQTASITGLTAGTTYYVAIRVTDTAGLHSPVAFASAAPDNTNPGTINDLVASVPSGTTVLLTWSPVGDDGATGTVTSYEVRYSTAAITVANFDAATLATATFSPATLLAGTATTDQTATVTGLTASTTYFVGVRGVDDAGNKGVFDSATFTTTTPDTTAPTGTFVITSATHTASVSSANNDPIFSWTVLTDAESPISYFTKLTTDAAFVLTATNGVAATGTTAAFTDVAGGTHYFHVIGVSEGGASAPATFEVVIEGGAVAKTAADAKTLSEKTAITLTQGDDKNTIAYSNSAALTDGATGGQIWAFNSPGVLIHSFGAADLASGTYEHTGSDAKADTAYLVTYFFTGDIGKFDATPPEEAEYTVTGPSAAETNFYEETWFIVVIIIVAVLLLLMIILLVIFATRKGKGGSKATDNYESDSFVDDGWSDDSWDEPAEATQAVGSMASQDYHLKCPSCATEFHVSGVTPLETSCPGCGAAGTLD